MVVVFKKSQHPTKIPDLIRANISLCHPTHNLLTFRHCLCEECIDFTLGQVVYCIVCEGLGGGMSVCVCASVFVSERVSFCVRAGVVKVHLCVCYR